MKPLSTQSRTNRITRLFFGLQGQSTPSAEEAVFLQTRLGDCARLGTLVSSFMLLFVSVVSASISRSLSILSNPATHWHLVATLNLAATWWIYRRGRHPHLRLLLLEALSLVSLAALLTLMAFQQPAIFAPHLTALLAVSLVYIARCIFVPSSPRRTLLLGVLMGIALLGTVAQRYGAIDPRHYAMVLQRVVPDGDIHGPTYFTLMTAAWWIASCTLGTVASGVIFGLRREVAAIRKLGPYSLEEKLGEGGMGQVFRARHALLRRPTAVKILAAPSLSDDDCERFEREVQLTASLTHPNTITVFDYGRTPDGVFYYAMELLEGGTLAEVVAVSGPQAPSRVIKILSDAASALVEAHAVGLIHRDIKPANIMLATQGGRRDVSKLLDFGLVKRLGRPDVGELTQKDAVLGTPLYMAPEAISDPKSVGPAVDLYALSAVGYFLLSGQHVFQGGTFLEICAQHLEKEPRPLSGLVQGVPPELDALIMEGLRKRPSDRPASAAELLRRLEALAHEGSWDGAKAETWWSQHGEELRSRRGAGEASQRDSEESLLISMGETISLNRRI